MGYVYFIHDKVSKSVKIGFATNYKTRLATLQIGNPNKLELVHLIRDVKMDKERELHRKYNMFLKSGEWFSDEVLSVIRQEKELDENNYSKLLEFKCLTDDEQFLLCYESMQKAWTIHSN